MAIGSMQPLSAPLPHHEPSGPAAARRAPLLRMIGVVCGLLLAVGVALIAVDGGSNTSELLSAGRMQSLWEADDSPHHNPYYNIFEDGQPPLGNYGQSHKSWTPEVVRERVWQTLKDVSAMERHVREQNELNTKMKNQITTLEGDAESEKKVIRVLIDTGVKDVSSKIQLLKSAATANVTEVKLMLARIETEQKAKQEEQDKAIDELTKKHDELESRTKTKFSQVDSQIVAAEKSLQDAKSKVAQERDHVKSLILSKIQSEVGGLDSELSGRLEHDKSAIRAEIDAGLSQLDGNISDYSLATGIRVARLLNLVTALKAKQSRAAKAQDADIATLQAAHSTLKAATHSTLDSLSSQVAETRKKLAEAQMTLEAEQALNKKVESEKLERDMATLRGDVTTELAAAQHQVDAKVSAGKDWVQNAVDNVHSQLQQSVSELQAALSAWETKAAAATERQESELGRAEGTQSKLTAEMQTDFTEMRLRLNTTEARLEAADKAQEEAVERRRQQLEDRIRSDVALLRASLEQQLRQGRRSLQTQLAAAEKAVQQSVEGIADSAADAMDSISKDVKATKQESEAAAQKQADEVKDLEEESDKLQHTTAKDLAELQARLKEGEEAVADAKHVIGVKQNEMLAHIRGEMNDKLNDLNTSVGVSLARTRAEVSGKVAEGMAQVTSKVQAAAAAALSTSRAIEGEMARLQSAETAASGALDTRVKTLEEDHAGFVSRTRKKIDEIAASLAHTKSALSSAEAAAAAALAGREATLRGEVQGALRALAANISSRVSAEEGLLASAKGALAAAEQAQLQAQAADASNRQAKLSALERDLATLQGTVAAIRSLPGPAGPPGPPGPPGYYDASGHAVVAPQSTLHPHEGRR